MQAVLLGPPGSGKGTQAVELSSRLVFFHLATGDILRQEVKNQTSLGQEAKAFMEKGELVPDKLILAMVSSRLESGRDYLWDGFPRTEEQAVGLDALLAVRSSVVDIAVLLEVSDEVIVERISGRMFCPGCGANYHRQSKPPKKAGICDQCAKGLQVRPDDRAEVVENRLRVYRERTEPLVLFYEKKGILARVDGNRDPQAVTADLATLLEKVRRGQKALNG